MSELRFSPHARSDLDDILEYIAQDRPVTAERVVARIRSKCERLAERPGLGQRRSDLGRGEFFVAKANSFLIIYRVIADGI